MFIGVVNKQWVDEDQLWALFIVLLMEGDSTVSLRLFLTSSPPHVHSVRLISLVPFNDTTN